MQDINLRRRLDTEGTDWSLLEIAGGILKRIELTPEGVEMTFRGGDKDLVLSETTPKLSDRPDVYNSMSTAQKSGGMENGVIYQTRFNQPTCSDLLRLLCRQGVLEERDGKYLKLCEGLGKASNQVKDLLVASAPHFKYPVTFLT